MSKQEERNEHPTAENASEEQPRMGTKLLEARVVPLAPHVLHYDSLNSQWSTIHLLQVLLHQIVSLPSLSHPIWCA